MWKLYFTKQAQKDARKLASSGLKTEPPPAKAGGINRNS